MSATPDKQSGAALLVFLALMVVTASYFLVSALNRVNMTIERDKTTQDALAQAKMALIGRAAADDNRPGSLPCPDADNDGVANLFVGNDCPTYVGRLPWKTLKLGDLRDASGERLWYILSPAFRDHNSAQPINSNSLGQLTLAGSFAANGVVAIVFAPGPAIGGQNRSNANVNDVSHYLEGENNTLPATPPSAFDKTFASSGVPESFNDRVIAVAHRELFDIVENVVARRMKDSFVTPHIANYFSTWGAYPFAAPFTNPTNCTYSGTMGTHEGLFPACTSGLAWPSGSISVSNAFPLSGSCTNSSSSDRATLNCTATYWGSGANPGLTITATVNAGMVLAGAKPVASDAIVTPTVSGATLTVTNVDASGNASATYTATLPFAGFLSFRSVTFSLPIAYSAGLYASDPNSSWYWFIANQWYKLSYYAVAPGYAPGGGSNCTPPNCLSINNWTPAPTNNKRAALVFVGRAIGSQTRPPATLSDYLEGENLSIESPRIFEKAPRSETFNDQVVPIAP